MGSHWEDDDLDDGAGAVAWAVGSLLLIAVVCIAFMAALMFGVGR